jgi:LysR family transcriptional regulator of beta-lactamase
MAQTAMRGYGVAILPLAVFKTELTNEWLVQPFTLSVATGSYWLVRLKSREPTAAMVAFRDWLRAEADGGSGLEEVTTGRL